MRNRAKCKLCESIIESFHKHDYVTCKCGEISIDGGNYHFSASAKDFNNFIRVDDEGNEILVKVIEKDSPKEITVEVTTKPSRKELMDRLDAMIQSIENLPQHAMSEAVNHYDWYSILILIKALFEVKE